MKKTVKFLSLFLLLIVLITGCNSGNHNSDESKYLKDITYEELSKKIDNKESFILEVVQTGCSNCSAFTPTFTSVLEEYKIKAYKLNIAEISSTDKEKFLDEYNVSGTPTVIFFEDGEDSSAMKRIVGNVNKDKVISKLRAAGYIE